MNDASGSSRSADTVVAWVLYGLQLAGELALAPLWLMSVMMTDSCGSVADEPAVCNLTYFTTGWFAFAGLLVAAAVATPVAIVVAGKRGKRRWKWPVIVIGALIAGTVGFVYAFTR